MRFRYATEEGGKLIKKAIVYTLDEHKINFSDVDNQAVYIIQRLQSAGFETYIVGGAVRDLILGKKPKDFDIVSSANPAKIKRIFRNSRIIGRRFRLVHVYFGPKIFEVSTFRSLGESYTGNAFGTIEEDVRRRDFSLNALFYDPLKQIVIDYVGGMKDIQNRIIKPVIPLSDIFTDDPVRMIRAAKYAAVANFKIPFLLSRKIRKHSTLLADISPSRLTEELFKIINSPYAFEIIKTLDMLKIFSYIQPRAVELFKSKGGFKARYFKTMLALNREDSSRHPGEAFASLIRDYLEDLVDWDGKRTEERGIPLSERFKAAFILARKFVLPINPPRKEIYSALRLLFSEHGVSVKGMRLSERPRPFGRKQK
ncbi:MAG: polynucleotide adenylyltransferase PcnB [Treponema sp.]|nr:polynucleotide adenylyltransferase PcnB [Treponema sp.]